MPRGAFPVFIGVLVVLHFLLRIGLGLSAAAPDLLLVAVLLAARRTTATGAVVLGLLLGIVDDATGVGNLGPRAIALSVVALLGLWSRRLVEGEGLLFIAAYIFAGKWMSDIIHVIVAPGTSLARLVGLMTAAPLKAAYAAISAMLAVSIQRRMAGPDA